jgi:hypothetical protein
MKINGATIQWNEGFLNHPELLIDVDRDAVNYDHILYENRGDLYYGESEGLVSFFAYAGPGDGYGGAKFPIKMKDGSKKTLIGPWSSRAGCMNNAGFGPCLDVVFRFNGNNCNRGAGAITLRLAQRIMKEFIKGAYLIPFMPHRELTFIPSLEWGRMVKPNGKSGKMVYDFFTGHTKDE